MKFFSEIKSVVRKKLGKKCKEQNNNGLYMDLAPEENISNAEEYFKELDWALKNKNVNNIALTGPYGAGKSSILKSFFARFHYNPINISIALFDGGETIRDYDEEKGKELIPEKNQTEKIARGFLQQLFYKVNYKRIPQSRFRKLHKISKGRIFIFLFIVTVVVMTTICIVDSNTALSIFERVTVWGRFLGFNSIISGVISIGIYSLIIFGLSCIIKWACTHVGNAEINIANTAKISKKTISQESVFDKYLDEIVYFFEENKYNVVVFEDIDRFDNVEIFASLRELNRLLNNYESIKQHITFVYALRDDFF